MTSAYTQPGTSGLNQDFWYKYDSLDRFVLTKGKLVNNVIVKDTTGTDITYNARGDRMSATYGSDGHVETYSYTNDGYLQTITTGGVLGAVRTMDLLGRVTLYTEYQSNGTSVLSTRDVTFDGDNRVTAETDITYGSGVTYTNQITNDYRLLNGSTYTGADQGVLTHTRKVQSQSGSSTTTTIDTDYSYVWWGQAKTSVITVKANSTEWLPGKSTFTYDVNGHLTSNKDGETNGVNRLISYTTDAFGQVLTRQESGNGKPGAKRTYFYLNGRTLGDVGTDKDSNVDYAQQLAKNRTSAANAGTTTISTNNAATPVVGLNGNFDANYDAFNPSSVAQAGSSYTAVGGEGLQAAALSVWGDASLWYLLAEANGLDAGTTLVAGQVLSVPNAVSNVHNNSGTFKPYNAAEAQGNTLPTLPRQPQPPARNQGCGAIGQIIVVIIAVVVTAIVAPYATAAVAQAASAAGASAAVAAGVGAVAGGAIAGAAGSIASQSFAVATGIQDKFSWSAVATAAIAGGVGGGVDTFMPGASGLTKVLTTNAVSQGINMAVGLQKTFDWTSLAVAGVAGVITNSLGGTIANLAKGNDVATAALTGTASLLANAATRTILTHDSFGESLKAALPGAIATTIGTLISRQMTGAMNRTNALTIKEQEDDGGYTPVSGEQGGRSEYADLFDRLARDQGYTGSTNASYHPDIRNGGRGDDWLAGGAGSSTGHRDFWSELWNGTKRVVGNLLGFDVKLGWQPTTTRSSMNFTVSGSSGVSEIESDVVTITGTKRSWLDKAGSWLNARVKEGIKVWAYSSSDTPIIYGISDQLKRMGYKNEAAIVHSFGTFNASDRNALVGAGYEWVKGTAQMSYDTLNPIGYINYGLAKAGVDLPYGAPNVGNLYDPMINLGIKTVGYGRDVFARRANPLDDMSRAFGNHKASWEATARQGLEPLAERAGNFVGVSTFEVGSLVLPATKATKATSLVRAAEAAEAIAAREAVAAASNAPEFVGPLIGKSGFKTSTEFAEAVGTRYQGYVDDAYVAAQRLESRGLLSGNPNTRVGDYVDRISARDLKAYLRSEGVSEGPGSLVEMNRWLRDPSGSGLYVRPDVRIPAAGRIYDATVDFKAYNSTQIMRFGQYSGGDRITIVRPSPLGSYSIVPRGK